MDKKFRDDITNISNHLHHLEELVESMETVLMRASLPVVSTQTLDEDDISFDIDMYAAVSYIVQKLRQSYLPKVRYKIDLEEPTKTTYQEGWWVFCVLRSICFQIMKKMRSADLQIEVMEGKSMLSLEINYYNIEYPHTIMTSSISLKQIESFIDQRHGELDIYSTKHHVFFTIVLPI